MNQKQSELFQKVLEQMETNLQENLNSWIESHCFDDAEYCFNGLKHVGNILDNFDGKIDRADMNWVLDELFGMYSPVSGWNDERVKEGTEFIKSFNYIDDDETICTNEEVKSLVDELVGMFDESLIS